MTGPKLPRALASAPRRIRGWVGRAPGEAGAVSTEYGLLLSFIVIVIIVAVTALGLAVADLFVRGNGF